MNASSNGVTPISVVEVPVGFKWFVDGLFNGEFAFAGEESAGASFLRKDGSVWTTDKDGFISVLDYKKWLAAKLPEGLSKAKTSSIIGLKATRIGASVLSLAALLFAGRYFMFNQKPVE